MPFDANNRAARGAEHLDSRIIPPDLDWRKYEAAPEHHKVRPASDYAEAVVDAFYAQEGLSGALWPWDKANDKDLRFRPGEVTIWAGINGERKSMLTGQVALGLMRQDEPVLMMSFEMSPTKTLKRMVRQSAGTSDPAIPYIKSWHRWTTGKLWLYDHTGICSPRQTIAVARYAATELGVKHIFIDSMMKVVSKTDDYSGQKEFIGQLTALALAHGLHVHVVAHARKGENINGALDKWAIKGASEITDQADNVVLVSRNADKKPGEFDQFLKVAKQRDGEYEGTLGLFFSIESLSFSEREGERWSTIRMDTFAESEKTNVATA